MPSSHQTMAASLTSREAGRSADEGMIPQTCMLRPRLRVPRAVQGLRTFESPCGAGARIIVNDERIKAEGTLKHWTRISSQRVDVDFISTGTARQTPRRYRQRRPWHPAIACVLMRGGQPVQRHVEYKKLMKAGSQTGAVFGVS